MKLVFVGPPGSGKGTEAKIISEKLGIPHISTGDLLREAKGEKKKQIDLYVNKGELFPDELMLEVLKERIEKPDCEKGFILDGFPRTLPQAEMLDKLVKIDKIIEVDISDKIAIARLSGRRNCSKCGAIYNINTEPKPLQESICDKCGAKLYEREDNSPEVIQNRLDVYHRQTKPILEKYNTLKINGEPKIEEVTKEILSKLK
ncbi:adenylate kinase family protein [Nanoarchaeota archaeon]